MVMEPGKKINKLLRRTYCCCVCNKMIWFRQKYSVALGLISVTNGALGKGHVYNIV